jgi:hypothetical protein
VTSAPNQKGKNRIDIAMLAAKLTCQTVAPALSARLAQSAPIV